MANRVKKADVTIERIECRASGEPTAIQELGRLKRHEVETPDNCPRKKGFDPSAKLGCLSCGYARIVTESNLHLTASFFKFLQSTRS